MADGSDRSDQRPSNAGYTMHPYYYQQYYAAQAGYAQPAVPGQQQLYPVVDPTQPGGYRWVHPMVYQQMMQQHMMYQQAAMMGQTAGGYYFPYTSQSTVSPTVTATSSSSSRAEPVAESSPVSDPPLPPSSPKEAPPLDALTLNRKTSRGFLKDKSKWRLNRLGSKPSLALDGNEDGEYMALHPSPMQGFSVSPRHCGTAFLPDDIDPCPKLKYTRSSLHLVDAIRIAAKELERPKDPELATRLTHLEEAMVVELNMTMSQLDNNDVIGLLNPLHSKICYLNSVMQILLPIAPLIQVLSMSLTHADERSMPWTVAIARSFRLFFRPCMGVQPSLLTVPGMDSVITDLGGVGIQQDVAEALTIVLDRLHEEWKHRLVTKPWVDDANTGEVTPSNHGLTEDSIVYKLFRGVKEVDGKLEIFTAIRLAPPMGGGMTLGELWVQTFRREKSQMQYLPPVLCIELSRHLSENKLTTSQSSVPFSGSLVVPLECCGVDCGRKYELVGVVVRSGVYANSGHFWVAQRRGQKWYWINDTEVSECNVTLEEQEDSVSDLISKKLDAASNWCILVYADVASKLTIHP